MLRFFLALTLALIPPLMCTYVLPTEAAPPKQANAVTDQKAAPAPRRDISGIDPIRDGSDTMELWAWYAAYDHVALAQLWGAICRRCLGRFRGLRRIFASSGTIMVGRSCPRRTAVTMRWWTRNTTSLGGT